MANNAKHVKEPLVHLTRRMNVPAWFAWLIRIGAFLLSILVCCLVSCLLSEKVSVSFFFKYLFEGAFGSTMLVKTLLRDLAIFLLLALAVTPCFEMRYWNIGGEGQAMMGAFGCSLVVAYASGKLPVWGTILLSFAAAVVLAVEPVLVAALDSLVPGGRRLGRLGWFGLVGSFIGIVLIFWPSLTAEVPQVELICGLSVAAIAWTIGTVYNARRPMQGTLFGNLAVQSYVGGLLLLLISFLMKEGGINTAAMTPKALVCFFYLIFVGSLGGFAAFFYISKKMSPARVMTYAYINPIVAIILGVLLNHEQFTLRTAVGALIIFSGVLLVQLSREGGRRPGKEEPAAKGEA